MNCDQVNPPEERDDERTLIYGRGNESLLSAEELRAALGVPSGERIEDYQGQDDQPVRVIVFTVAGLAMVKLPQFQAAIQRRFGKKEVV